jgi:tetratricopeptide (TPR) repeat protein
MNQRDVLSASVGQLRTVSLPLRIGLVILAATFAAHALAETHTTSLELQPRQPETLSISLKVGEVACVKLRLKRGILGVRAISPEAHGRPLWLIDLGRGALLTYVVGGKTAGTYVLEITSYERAKVAELSVEVDAPSPADTSSMELTEAEDNLANAELIRRHWPTAPTGEDAIQLYDRALTASVNSKETLLQRLILTQKARYLIFGRNQFSAAKGVLQQAISLPLTEDLPEQALTWKTMSTVLYDLGEYQPAIEAGLSALKLYRQEGDVYWQGIVLGNLSSVYAELGRGAEALEAAREALRDAQEERDSAGIVYCLSQLAGLYQQQGDLEGALRTYHEGLRWIAEINYAPLVEAEIQKDLGSLYIQVGDWEQANLALGRCIALEGRKNDPVSLTARGLLGAVAQHEGRLREGITDQTTAIEVAHALSLKQEEAKLLLKRASMERLVGQKQLQENDIEAARQLSISLASLPLQVEIAVATGDLRISTDVVASEASYQSALHLAKSIGELEEQSVALAGLARAYQREGRLEEARLSIESALRIVETSRGNLISPDLQVTYFSMHRSWYELAVDICVELSRHNPGKGYEALAFTYTERSRARSLLDTLDSSGYTAAVPLPESLREAYAKNLKDSDEQQSLLADKSWPRDQDPARRLQELYLERHGLEARIQSMDGRLGSLTLSSIVDVAQIQRGLLDRHSVLLSYWIGDSQSYRWMITYDGVSMETLPSRKAIENLVLPLEKKLQSRRPLPAAGADFLSYVSQQHAYETAVGRSLSRAGSLLLHDLPHGVNTVVVVSDDCLRSLPFGALRTVTGTYALTLYKILLQPSASVAFSLKQHPITDQAHHITVFADPVFSQSDERLKKHTAELSERYLFADLQRLPGSMQEARAISQYAPRDLLTLHTGFDASPARVRELSTNDAFILHFATHTVTVQKHPEITGIALSTITEEGEKKDGVFWLKDVYALHLPSSLVVLSGCGTNQQSRDTAEGLNNLAYAFFFAGARSVIGSLWSVDDSMTSRVMNVFYRELLTDHKRADEALRIAQLQMLANPRTSSPAHWASFVIEGWPSAFSATENPRAIGSVSASSSVKEK